MNKQNARLKLNASTLKKNILFLILSLSTSFIVLLLALFAVSGIFCAVDISLYAISPLTTICISLATLSGGFTFGAVSGSNGLVGGLGVSVLIYVVIIIASVVCGQFSMQNFSLIKLIAVLVAGMLGGYLGITFKEKLQHHH